MRRRSGQCTRTASVCESYQNGSDGNHASVQMKRQLREQLGKNGRDGSLWSNLFGGVVWITRRQSQLESEPCEAVRSNPSRQHGSTRATGSGHAKIEKSGDQTQRWISSSHERPDDRDAQRSDECVGITGMNLEPTKWLDVMKNDVERSKHRSSLCRKRVNRWD